MYFALPAPRFIYIGVFFSFLNISTGEVSGMAGAAALHLEVLWNEDDIRKWNKQLWGMV